MPPTLPTPQPVLHMLAEEDWHAALRSGRVEAPSLAAEGFIHCTNGYAELASVANRYYTADPRPYLALSVDLDRVGSPWRYDDAACIYPHVYGIIPVVAVRGARLLARTPTGRFLGPLEATMNAIGPLLERLEGAAARLASTRQRVEDGTPWPVGAVADGGGEGEWGPTEVLAHVDEMLQFWLGEMERVLAGADGRGGPGGAPVHFGRTPGDQLRAGIVVRDATLPPRELFDRMAALIQRYRWRLPELTADDIARTGVHPTRGEISVPELLEVLVVSHLEGHAEQLDRSLGH